MQARYSLQTRYSTACPRNEIKNIVLHFLSSPLETGQAHTLAHNKNG